MASAEEPARADDRHGRRRPFSNWVKRLANLKGSNADGNPQDFNVKRSNQNTASKGKKSHTLKNNPYPSSSTRPAPYQNGHLSDSESRPNSPIVIHESTHATDDAQNRSGPKAHSRPATLSTTGETAISDATGSKAGTSATAARTDGGGNSTFSSPAPSVRSMTTTLTTVQSAAASGHGNHALAPNGSIPVNANSTHGSSQFSHPFPPSSSPATNGPSHLAPHHQHTTYTSATANNALTDDASILTLASSSKRRRRNSADTNASMRALAPASMFGGSRESLPLSVLSGIIDPSAGSVSNAPGTIPRPSLGGLASAERASIYSSSGAAPALSTDRNSYYASKQGAAAGDGASVRSGLVAHGRNDSITNSIGGGGGGGPPTSPFASSFPVAGPSGKISRQSSGWGERPSEDVDVIEKTEDVKS